MNKHQDTKQDPRDPREQKRQQDKSPPQPNKGQPGQQRADTRAKNTGSRSRSEAN